MYKITCIRNIQNIRNIHNINNIKTILRPVQTFRKFNTTNKENKLYEIDVNNDKNTHINNIKRNEKLNKYITDVYKYTGVGFATTLGVSVGSSALIPFVLIPQIMPVVWIGGFGTSLYSIYKMSKIPSITNSDMTEDIPEEKKKYYTMFSISNGITLTPIVFLSFVINPSIFPIALTSTIATFGGATYFALKQSNLDSIKMEAPLMGGVCGLIGTNLVVLGAGYCGFIKFADTLDLIATFASVGIFTGLIVVDTQKAIQSFNNRTLDTIKSSTEMVLDMTNLLVDFIKLLIRLQKRE